MKTIATASALQTADQPVQLSLVAPAPLANEARVDQDQDALAWQLGFDHARHGVALPVAHLHPNSSLYPGYQAALARRMSRHRDPNPAVRRWLQLRLQAWLDGVAFEDQLLTPHYLQQLDSTHCPVLRTELHDEHGHPHQRRWVRLLQDQGYAAGHIVVLGDTAARALAGRRLAELQDLSLQAARQGEALEGLSPTAWARLVSLVASVTPGVSAVLMLLPPNRLHLAQATTALQAWLTRQLGSPGWSQRLQGLHDALPGVPQRQAATLLTAALAPHAVGLPLGGLERRWALEDLWQDPRVQRRWSALVGLVSPLTVERLLRELPAPAGWVVERHTALLAA